ncbi:RDD family protein [Streptomyces sp. NBC_00154]|uniref:RDD family protein n=1 Tax=Streptomyces sp. NBC_00154 TaxID=2975670 RepID=UPI0022535D2A|nr:RDD family protein [Streptomyces sp. NBC_00154]MCX5312855.1 RDD family protein [Streptomyces sp. NBC_00154]
MSNDQPTPGQPPEDDPFLKKPQEPPTPPSGSAAGSEPGPGAGAGSESGPGSGQGSGPGSGSPYDRAQPPPPPPPPYDPNAYGGGPYGGTDPLAGMPPLAEPGKRILARLIDFLIISIPLYLISLPFGGAVDVSDNNGNGESAGDVFSQTYSGHQLLWSLIALVVYVAYDTYFTHKDGRTIGKRLLKLRVAMLNDGRVPDTSASFLRAVVLWLPALLCCPCLWWLINIVLMFTDKPYRQGLHDKAAKTVVVSTA